VSGLGQEIRLVYGDGTYPLKETLYSEVEASSAVIRIKSNSGPFLFLCPRIFLVRGPFWMRTKRMLRLTPGSEMFFNFMADLAATKESLFGIKTGYLGTELGPARQLKPDVSLNRKKSGTTISCVASWNKRDAWKFLRGVAHWNDPAKSFSGWIWKKMS